MDTKPFFLPSEVARLVLGYLMSQGFDQTSKRFLIECDCLTEFKKLKNMGLEYPTNILGLSLVEILDNFGFMKTQALERYNIVAATDTMWRDLESCIDKLKYKMLQCGSNKLNVPKIRTNRKFPDRNVQVLPENIGEMLLKQGKILSSKQLAQTIKKVHETMKTNEHLKENRTENSSTDNHLAQNVNLARQHLRRAPSIPVKELSGSVEDEDFSEEIEESAPTLAESNKKDQNGKYDKHDNDNNNDGNGETAPAGKHDTPHNTEFISGTSPPSQTPNCHASETVDDLPTATTSRTSTKQPDSGNPSPCVPTPNRQLSSSSGLTQTATIEPEVTAVPQLGVSVSLPPKVSDSGCNPQPTESKPLYQSVGTQSDLSLMTSPSQPTTSSNKPCVTTPLETIPSTSTEVQVATPSKSLPLIPESTPNTELSANANTLPSPMDVTPTSDELPVEPQDVSNQENDQSTDSLLKDSDTVAETASLSLSSSPPSLLLGITSSVSSKSFPSVYKTPEKNLQNPYRSPCKENGQPETLNTPTKESLTPVKQSESDNAKSKRKRYPPEKRWFDISVPGPSQVRYESGNSQDSCHLKDPIPTFVEKVITETSLAEVLAETINRKLHGEAKSEITAKSSENKNVEEGHKVECDIMDEIMLTDFHMTKCDIDEVIHQTSSAGIPVLDDLLKLFASVSEEKDNLFDDECTEPVYDGVEFEELDSCSQSAQNKEVKLVTSEDDFSKSDLKTSKNTCELSSLSKPPTTFLQVVDKLCSSEASTEPSSNQASEDLSHKSFSTTLEDQEQNSENPAPKMLSVSESFVKDLQPSDNINSSDNPKQDQTSSQPKEVSMAKHPSPCSRRTKVFSKGKSRKLIATPVLKSPNKSPAPIPPNSPASISSFTPILSPSANDMPSDTHSHPPQSTTTSLVSDTHSNITTLTSESTNETTSTSSDIHIPISSSIHPPINTTPLNTSPTNLAGSSFRNTLTIAGTAPVTISSELPVEHTPATTSASLSNNLTTTTTITTTKTMTTTTTTTVTSAPSILQASANSSLLVQQPLLSGQSSKIFSASISESSSVITRVIQPEVTASLTKYPVMYIIAPPSDVPLQLQPTQTSTVSDFASTNVQCSWTTDKTALAQHDSESLETVHEESAVQQTSQTKPKKPKRPRGRPKKGIKEKPKPKIYNIAPNRNLNTLNSTSYPVNTELLLQLQEKVTLAVSTDNSWTIEMTPGTEVIVLNLKSPHTHQLVSYQLTAEQVKDHLASFIGTSTITDHILKCMETLPVSRTTNKPNILSHRKTHKNKTPAQKITSVTQPVAGESSSQTQVSGHQNNSCPTGNTGSKQIHNSVQEGEELIHNSVQEGEELIYYSVQKGEELIYYSVQEGEELIHNSVQKGEEPILYVATSLGKIEDFWKKTQTETHVNKDSPKQIATSSSASQVIKMTDSHTSPVIEKSSPNLPSSLSKEETFVEESAKKSPNCIGDLPLNFSKGVSASSSGNNSNNPRTTDPLIKDNEYLAINILSTLCYSQSECCTKADPTVDASQPKETEGGHSFCDVSAASPAKCYKILMEGKKEGQVYAQVVDMPDKSAPVLQEHDGDKPSDMSDIIGYVDAALYNLRKGTSEMKCTTPHFNQEDKTLVSSEEQETGQTKETKGCDGKKIFDKSPRVKTRKPAKRKLYDAFPDKQFSGQKTVNKINRTDIDLLLTRLHPDSLDGFDGNT